MRCFVLAQLILLSCGRFAAGADLYVNNLSGDDARSGISPVSSGRTGGPFRSFARAMKAANHGDRVVLANTGEPYRESVTVQSGRHSGDEDYPFIIEGNGAILDGTVPIPPDAWRHFTGDLFRFRPSFVGPQQLFIDGKPPVERRPNDGEFPPLEPREWCQFGGEVYFRPEKDRLPSDYPFALAEQRVGITLYDVRHVMISNLIVQGFQLDGINAHDNAFQVRLVGITARGNARSGISVGGASRVTILDCLVGNNGQAQVRTEGHSITKLVGSELLDNTAPPLVSFGGRVIREEEAK